jgi:hypothetical protein
MECESYLNSARQYILMIIVMVGAALPSSLWAKGPNGAANSPAQKTSPATSNQASEEAPALKEQLARQQARIEQLERALETVTRRLDQLADTQRGSSATPPGQNAVASTTPIVPAGVLRAKEGSAGSLVASAVAPPVISPAPVRPPAEASKPKSSPLSFQIGDAEFTPGGFMDFTTVFRSTNLGSGVATSFGTIPYSVIGGAPNPAGRMTEIRSLAQNSRISMKVTSKVGEFNVTGYFEGDFAGNNPNSLFVTSNSSTFRLRHYWAQLVRGKFELLGGQAWTLMTPGRTGISPVSTDLFISQVQDSNYQLGITWGRQSQFRMVYHPNKQWAMALSIENPNQYLSTGVVLPNASFNSQFDMAGSQVTTPNLHPDISAKVAYDPSVSGRHMHAELGGIVRSFKDFNPSNNTSSTITGGGVAAGVNIELTKNFRLIANGLYSYGGGRYMLGLGPDVIVKPDGTLSGVHAGSGVAGFEYQMKPQILLFGYYGGAYFQRNTGYTLDASGNKVWVGFGAPTTATTELNANRAVQEPTFGITRTFWKSPKYGSFLWVNQYSYVTRAPWIVPSGSGKDAHLGVVYTDLRYVLP